MVGGRGNFFEFNLEPARCGRRAHRSYFDRVAISAANSFSGFRTFGSMTTWQIRSPRVVFEIIAVIVLRLVELFEGFHFRDDRLFDEGEGVPLAHGLIGRIRRGAARNSLAQRSKYRGAGRKRLPCTRSTRRRIPRSHARSWRSWQHGSIAFSTHHSQLVHFVRNSRVFSGLFSLDSFSTCL